ncbi:hypothetical protein [uncultured Aquitalea sp.]|uniref:hypothetical protein n=1 Tax=uncultured Aquitalea sp. TaxID=540272 RepID=UPI0025D5B316|nr:hypothetical protein [uncultured Aquitalea sp.]
MESPLQGVMSLWPAKEFDIKSYFFFFLAVVELDSIYLFDFMSKNEEVLLNLSTFCRIRCGVFTTAKPGRAIKNPP